VAVTGLGLVTPAGIGVQRNWTTICAGKSMAAPDVRLRGLSVDFSCAVPSFDANALLGRRLAIRLDAVTQYAMVAAREAVADAGLDAATWDGARVGVVVGTSFGGCTTYERQQQMFQSGGPGAVSPLLMVMAPVNMTAGYLGIDLSAGGPNLVVSTACASGATAVGTARALLISGACDVAVAGGSECFLTPTTIASLANLGAVSRKCSEPQLASRPFDIDRDGFVAGEGAAMLILERTADARARGARVRANIAGYGASADGHHPSAPEPNGRGAERAVRAALADAGLTGSDIRHVNAHGTSTRLNDVTEGAMLSRVIGDHPAVTSTKGVTGHLIGAAGAAEAAYTVLAVQQGTVPPTANLESQDPAIDVDVVAGVPRTGAYPVALSNSFGFGGQNAALVVTAA
jgi:3-oxoacyl-[acyl-carrier-protein] synthase II